MRVKHAITFIIAALSVSAFSQLYPAKLGILGSSALRLGEPRVQTELKVSETQVSAISDVLSDLAVQQAALSKEITQSKPEQYQAIQGKMEAVEAASAGKLLKTLTAKQQERLWQLAIQDVGPFALRNPVVAKKIGMTAEQRMKIEVIAKRVSSSLDEFNAKMGAELENVGSGKAGDKKRTAIVRSYEPRMKAVETKGELEVIALLSKAQMAQWMKAKGAPFKL